MSWWRRNKQLPVASYQLSATREQQNLRSLLKAVCQLRYTVYCLLIPAYCSAQSVLSEGVWVKIGVTQTGVYRLDRDALVRQNPAFANADPRRLRLYGNGGAPLPQPNATPRPADLTENAVLVPGETDGRFDAGDALLFFGQSPHTVRYDSVSRRFTHQINPYADTTFYFLTIGTANGLRVVDRPAGTTSTPTTVTSTVTTFTDYQFYEPDRLKLPGLHTGRDWLADYLTTDTVKTVPFDLPGLLPNVPVRLRAGAVAGAKALTEFRLSTNGVPVGAMPMLSISGSEYDYQGYARSDTFVARPSATDGPLQLQLAFIKNGQTSASGYLDFLSVEGQRELRQYSQPVWTRRVPAGLVAVRQATATLRVWDVTNPLGPVAQTYVLATAAEAHWQSGGQRDYFLFTDAQLRTPVSVSPVANQNLREQPVPNLLIVTPAAWRDQAERLAKFRRENDGLSALVVTTQQVYNEFGSGQPDPTAIRDAVRYFYQRQPDQMRYLLLFGDATYDYRNINAGVSPAQLASMVPVYESRQSLHPVQSYSSDDYFGFMDALAGQWPEDYEPSTNSSNRGDYLLQVGVGRLPVKSSAEAQTVVDKLIRYATDRTLAGDWQTRVMLVADDGDFNVHQRDADKLANQIESVAPDYRPERIFLDNFPQQVSTTGTANLPAVNQLISRAMIDGRLIINYNGHGGVRTLADEQIVTLTDILSWRNQRLPLLVTATCQFGRYDDPAELSGAELALLSRTGGAVGLLTTTRPVYSNTNFELNKAFYSSVFAPVNGQMPRLGDVMRGTKNNSLSGSLNRNFALLGDPSMRLAYPQAQIALTAVNGRALTDKRIDTLRAGQVVELTGAIRQAGQPLTDFAGTARLTLFDKAVTQTTLGQKGNPKLTYQAVVNPIFSGQAPVQQGRFTVRFTMPRDIDYVVGPARLLAYAIRSDSLADAAGSSDQLRVGGSVTADSVDTEPPVLTMTVVGGQQTGEVWRVVGPDVTVRIGLSDNRGINVARSGLGHELTAQLSGQSAVILNDEYIATDLNGRQGTVLHPFRGLLPGTYTLQVKAWDINNNSTGGALTLVVSERPGLTLRAVRVSPNPVSEQAVFLAEHDRIGEPLDWTLSVHDLNGRQVDQQTGQCTNCPGTVQVGVWSGLGSVTGTLPNGLYVIKLQLRAATDQTTATGSSRVVLSK